MGSKLAGMAVLFLFSLPFSGVGVLATWGIGKVFVSSSRAGDWVLVQAKVDEA